MSLFDKPQIPLIIGITGHRDIMEEDICQIKSNLRRFIYTNILPLTQNTPIVLITGFADGADRLVVNSFLEICNENNLKRISSLKESIRIVVPLPLPLEEYLVDLKDDSSRTEFKSFISKEEVSTFELPIVDDLPLEVVRRDDNLRSAQYASLGEYMVRNSQLLIALWDGTDNNRIGGTASTVNLQLKGISPQIINKPRYFDNILAGPIYHIPVRRLNGRAIDNLNAEPNYIFPDMGNSNITFGNSERISTEKYLPVEFVKKAKSFYDNIFITIDKLNKDIINNSVSSCFNKPENNGLGLKPALLDKYFHIIDSLAINFKEKRDGLLRCLLVSVVVAVICFQLYLEFFNHPFMLFLYPVTILFGIAVYLYAKRNKYEIKHEDYRAIAEGLRIQKYWFINDINDSVTDHYLSKHKGELEWIKHCIRNIIWLTGFEKLKNEDNLSQKELNFNYTLDNWILDQKKWFKHRYQYYFQKSNKLEKLSNIFYASGIIFAIVLLIIRLSVDETQYLMTISPSLLHHICVLMIGLSLALTATIKGYKEKMVLSDQTKQYSRMATIFDMAEMKIKNNINPFNKVEIKNILYSLGEESLVENADWLLMHRSHKIEIPNG